MGCPGSCPGCFQPCCPQLGSGLGQRPSASRAVDLQHETHKVLTDSTLLEVGSQTCVGPERSMVQPLPRGRSALRALITPFSSVFFVNPFLSSTTLPFRKYLLIATLEGLYTLLGTVNALLRDPWISFF